MRLAYFVRYKLAKLNKVQQVARIMDGTIYRANLKCKTNFISCNVKPKRSVLYHLYEIFKKKSRAKDTKLMFFVNL